MSQMADDKANSDTIYVSNAAELEAALQSSTGGETILLAPGNYGELGLYDKRDTYADFPSEVTIKSADPDNKAVFTGLDLNGVSNLSIDSVVFDYTFNEGDHERVTPFVIRNDAEGIKISNSEFDGDLGAGLGEAYDGYGVGFGLTVRDSSGITLDGNTFTDFHRGATFGTVSDITITNNDVSRMSTDGFNFAEVNNVLIEGNYFHDFAKPDASAAHQDMIQFWTAGTDEPSTDIIIRGNILNSEEGDETQSIFMRNELVDNGVAGEELFYQNVLIEDNVIHNAHFHGITVGETDGLTIRNNTLLQNTDAASGATVHVPSIQTSEASKDVKIVNNVTPRVIDPSNPEHVVENNILVQRDDPNLPNYYGDIFVNGLAGSSATLEDLKIVPGSVADGYGSSLTAFDGNTDGLAGYITDDIGTGLSSLSVAFDASNLFLDGSGVDLSNATVVWEFGDGSTAEGVQVDHTYEKGGEYDAVAHVTFAGGETVTLEKSVEVRSPVILDISFDNGTSVDATDYENAVALSSGVTLEGSDAEAGMRLNGGYASIEPTQDFYNNSEYTFAFDLKADPGSEISGKFIDFPYSFVFMLGENNMRVAVVTDKGSGWIDVSYTPIADGAWHNVALTFSGETGKAILYFDGKPVGQMTGLEGAIQEGSTSHNLVIGDATGRGEFTGLVSNVKFLNGAVAPEKILDLDNIVPDDGVKDEDSSQDDNTPPAPQPKDDASEQPDAETPDNADSGQEPDSDPPSNDEAGIDVPDPIPNVDTSMFIKTAGSDGDDLLKDRVGNRYVDGGAGNDTIRTGDNDDVLIGGEGDDSLAGYGGNDTLIGGEGDDNFNGGAGDDLLIVDHQDSVIRGGLGFDTMRLESAKSGVHDLSNAYITGIELIDLTNGGQDIVSVGHKDADRSDDGTLRYTGDRGDVVVLENDMSYTGTVVLDGVTYFEFLSSPFGTDRYFHVDTNLTVVDNRGNVVAGADNLAAAADSQAGLNTGLDSVITPKIESVEVSLPDPIGDLDVSNFETSFGSDGDDLMKDRAGNRFIDGGAGNDTILSGNADDVLIGGAGNDSLASYDGNDILIGGIGSDTMNAGAGDDLLVFDTSDISLRGGEGYDTAQIGEETPSTLDLSSIYMTGVEQVSLDNEMQDILLIDDKDIAGSDNGALKINGDVGDVVVLQSDMAFVDVISSNGVNYFELSSTTGSGESQTLYVETDLTLVDANGSVVAGLENLITASESGSELNADLSAVIQDPYDFL